MPGDGGRIREQAVDRDQSRERWKDRQQAVVGHARGQRQHPVLGDVGIDPQQNVLPSARRDLGGRTRLPAAVAIACRFGSSRVSGPVSRWISSSGDFDRAAFFRDQYGSQGRCHQKSHPRDDGSTCPAQPTVLARRLQRVFQSWPQSSLARRGPRLPLRATAVMAERSVPPTHS